MATLARAPGAGSIGLGFAIPARAVVRIAEEIIATGSSRTPIMGITIDTSFTGPGALIDTVTSGGPAEVAGLRPGDVVLALGGRQVRSTDELLRAVAALKPGTRTAVVVQRGGQRAEVAVTVAERPAPATR
jgi:putative serine protease PepD